MVNPSPPQRKLKIFFGKFILWHTFCLINNKHITMAKIKTKMWIFPIEISTIYNEGKGNESWLVNKNFRSWRTTSEHGRSKGVIVCPCCGSHTSIYLWSFAGGGKKCNSCGVLIGYSGALIDPKKVTDVVRIKNEIHKK